MSPLQHEQHEQQQQVRYPRSLNHSHPSVHFGPAFQASSVDWTTEVVSRAGGVVLTDCPSFFECGLVGGKSGRDNVTVVGLDQGEYEVVGLEFHLS
jgi:hypothetical protein